MHEIYELKEMLCKELEKYGAKGDLSAGELEIVDKLAHTVKNLCKIVEAYEEEEGEYSGNMGGMSYQRGGGQGGNRGGNRGGGSNRGGSYARERNTRRDNMGRYSSERGYSRAADDMVEQLRDMMEEAPDQQTRKEIQRLISKMEQM